MAAIFNVMLDTGGSAGSPGIETNTDSLGPPNVRFKQADDANIDSNDPIQIPTDSSTNYSYWKQVYLKCATAPDTQVDNVKFFTDGTGFGAGITTNVGSPFPEKSSTSDAGYDPATSAVSITTHANVSSASDVFTYTSGTPLDGPTISETNSTITASGNTTDYLVLGMEVTSGASPGNLSDETFTFRYDEI